MDIVKAKLDIVFKALFANKDNIDLLQDFLASMLDIPVEEITEIVIENPEIYPEDYEEKFCRLDLKLTVNNIRIDVEMQICNEGNYPERSLFYWAKMFSSTLPSGYEYSKLNRCISLNILGFNIYPEKEKFHWVFKPIDTESGKVLTDKMELHYFELKKVSRRPKPVDKKQMWLNFINSETEEDLAMIEEMNVPVMNKAVMVLRELSGDEILREKARMREESLLEITSAVNHAKREGLAEGRAKGQEELIAQFRKLNVSEDIIKEALKGIDKK